MTPFELEQKANDLRLETLRLCIKAGTGHVTSCMSCAEILACLYYGVEIREGPYDYKFILSKGQASPILYAVLADRGLFPREWLDQFASGTDGFGKDAPFGVHLQCTVPGVRFTTGSLGHGLGYAAGVAKAAKMDSYPGRVFVLLGDAELYEGSNWEVATFAAHHGLSNLIAIVDRNHMGVNGYTEEIAALEPLSDKFLSFGWKAQRVNGHSAADIMKALMRAIAGGDELPQVIIADTIKGRGIASMVGNCRLHGTAPSGEKAIQAVLELKSFIEKHERNGGY